jgi:hypothetical protein
VWSFGFMIEGLGLSVHILGFTVYSLRFRGQGSEFRVCHVGMRV